jgi:hypothetical protein
MYIYVSCDPVSCAKSYFPNRIEYSWSKRTRSVDVTMVLEIPKWLLRR